MNTPSFLKRLMVSANPSVRARSNRKAKYAIELCRALMTERGEISAASKAREALAAYQDLSEAGMESFFGMLVSEFSPDPGQVLRAADCYRDQPTQENMSELQRVVEPPRQELFRRLNTAPGGTATLVAMRRQVLRGIKSQPDWKVIDADLVHLFTSWFNRGFLTLERIDWHTPAIVLEKLFSTKLSMKSAVGRICAGALKPTAVASVFFILRCRGNLSFSSRWPLPKASARQCSDCSIWIPQ